MPSGLPRARGGVPERGATGRPPDQSSPRTRGCSRNHLRRRIYRVVFPAHAGVFPWLTPTRSRASCLPRARGGVPPQWSPTGTYAESSPRTRGCSHLVGALHGWRRVFPAHAGVFPIIGVINKPLLGLPRARGGVPIHIPKGARTVWSSPRTRGCSRQSRSVSRWAGVFPAHAGVFPLLRSWVRPVCRLPRARGGVPKVESLLVRKGESSPRTRGCSQQQSTGT